MRRLLRVVVTAVTVTLFGVVSPAVVIAGAGGAPAEPCVPGTVWEDPSSGVKWLCIYDEMYGGPRWDVLPSGQSGARTWLARSSTYGCVLGAAGLSAASGGGASVIARSYRWPCAGAADRSSQPIGEIRVRMVIQHFGGTWTLCRDTGYAYNTSAATGWRAGIDMGGAPDCGTGMYRAWGFGAIYQGGAWRGSSLLTPSLFLD